MNKSSIQDPLHGVTLKMLLTWLLEKYGWEGLSSRINIKCFTNDPSIASSLKFLRKTPWARQKVEALYLRSIGNVWNVSQNKQDIDNNQS